MIILLLKLLHAILISGLTVSELPDNNTTQNTTDTTDVTESPIGVWYVLALVFTFILLFVEIIELVAIKLEYFHSLTNWIQFLHCILIIVYQILLYLMEDNDYLNALGALVVFIAWLDLSVSLKSLMFSKWSNLGLYITMLIEVKKKFKQNTTFIAFRLPKKSA